MQKTITIDGKYTGMELREIALAEGVPSKGAYEAVAGSGDTPYELYVTIAGREIALRFHRYEPNGGSTVCPPEKAHFVEVFDEGMAFFGRRRRVLITLRPEMVAQPATQGYVMKVEFLKMALALSDEEIRRAEIRAGRIEESFRPDGALVYVPLTEEYASCGLIGRKTLRELEGAIRLLS